MIDVNRFWDSKRNTSRRATAAEIDQWEQRHGVTFPKLLREAYLERNGGVIRASELELLPLARISPPDDDFWEECCCDEDDDNFADRSLVFLFGRDDEVGAQYHLNYNGLDADAEPSVWSSYHDDAGMNHAGSTVNDFLRPLLDMAGQPEVDWNETRQRKVLAEETIDESYWMPKGSQTKYVLLEAHQKLVLFIHRVNLSAAAEESLVRMELPLPLVSKGMSIGRRHQNQTGPWTLCLAPEDSNDIVYLESKRVSNDEWKNARTMAAPVYIHFESESDERLQKLRVTLIGANAASQQQREDDVEQAWTRQVQSMSPDEQLAAGLHLMRGMRSAIPDVPIPEDMPPEMAEASRKMSQSIEDLLRQMDDEVGDIPIPPEAAAMLNLMKQNLQAPPQ